MLTPLPLPTPTSPRLAVGTMEQVATTATKKRGRKPSFFLKKYLTNPEKYDTIKIQKRGVKGYERKNYNDY